MIDIRDIEDGDCTISPSHAYGNSLHVSSCENRKLKKSCTVLLSRERDTLVLFFVLVQCLATCTPSVWYAFASLSRAIHIVDS